MADPIQGILEVQVTPGNTTRITLDPNSADITAGGNGGGGDLILRYPNGTEAVRLGRIQEITADPNAPTPTVIADYIGLRIRDGDGRNTVQIGRRKVSTSIGNPADEILVIFGAQGSSGTLGLVDKNGDTRFHMGEVLNEDGQFIVRDGAGREVLRFNSNYAALYVGTDGNEGDLIVRDGAGRDIFRVNGSNAGLYVGANGNEGDVVVRDSAGHTAIHLNGSNAAVYVGANGNEGDVVVRDSAGRDAIHLNGSNAAAYVGANGNEGDVVVRDNADRDAIHLNGSNAAVYVGTDGNEGDVVVRNGDGNDTIHLNGSSGDIILKNADCAEEFDVAACEAVEPGTVMVLNAEGKLCQSRRAYDTKVAGVISGAGDYRPGILLDKGDASGHRVPVALLGKVFCKVDAHYGAIDVGDLLTTSATPGHAMKASDPLKAFGAVIGKALRPHAAGQGLIPIMVVLQ